MRVAPPPAPIASATFGDSGYTVCRSARGDHLVFDTGPHGFLNGGHAHADALAVTLTVAGRPLFVDPGTACYTIDPVRRDRFRSTRLHNTLTLDGRPQSEPAGPFHWRSTADGARLAWCTTPGFDYVEGAHGGYAPVTHRRAVFARPGAWVIADRVIGAGLHDAELCWHLDPRWTVEPTDDGWLRLTDGAGDPVWIASPQGALDIVRGDAGAPSDLGWIAPAYGQLVPTTTLRLAHRGDSPFAIVTVVVEAAACPSLEALAVLDSGSSEPSAAAIRLRAGDVTDTVVFGSTTRGDDVFTPRRCSSAGGLETDAAFLWSRQSAAGARTVAIVDGRIVRTDDGRTLLELAAPVSFKETVA
jgi:heparinase II/III-like protein